MIINVDARTVYRCNRRGIGKSLIDLYKEISVQRRNWKVTMLHCGEASEQPFSSFSNIHSRTVHIPGGWHGLWSNVRLPMELIIEKADVLHAPANIGPVWPCKPMVATIHDLIPLDPQFVTTESKKWGERVRRTARVARKIMTPSEFSKQKIIEFSGIPDDKIVVNSWAPDRKYHQVTEPDHLSNVRLKYGLDPDKKYAFGFGAEDPRKNTEKVLIAWSKLPQGLRNESQLLLVGIQEQSRLKFQQLASHLQIADSCRLHGFADEGDIAPLLSGASLLVFPSLSEGFGLPVLDAFACGAAVLTSNVTSLPEIAGDAALLVDPTNVGEITDGVRQLLTNDTLQKELVKKGAERVEQFTWDACAQRAIDVFEEVVN